MKRFSINEEECAFEMAPMIDMVFLLLIFFMCASTLPNLTKDRYVKLPVADDSVVPKNKKHEAVINIRKEGEILWGQEQCDIADITDFIGNRMESDPEMKVYIRADKEVPHRFVRQAIDACAKAGAMDIQFAAYQTEN
jgi:biopolymer transport protein ExbD